MSTGDPQLIHWLLTAFFGLTLVGNTILAYYVARKTRDLRSSKLDIAELFERVEALQDRFTRFQRREGMREVREKKTGQQDLLEEAQAIVAQGATGGDVAGQSSGPATHPKVDLYRRRRTH